MVKLIVVRGEDHLQKEQVSNEKLTTKGR